MVGVLSNEVTIAFFTFMSIRYYLPNFILEKPTTLWTAFILSSCYALSVYIRKHQKSISEFIGM